MLIALISISWLTIVGFVVMACRSAAHGDELLARPLPAVGGRPDPSMGLRRALWREGSDASRVRALRGSRSGAAPTGRGVRGRGARCAAGS